MGKDLSWLGARLCIDGKFVDAARYGSGHINDTYAATYTVGTGRSASAAPTERFIHQRLNGDVFRDQAALMDNFSRVTGHIRGKLREQGVDEIDRRVLTLIPTRDGREYVVDDDGGYWRTYRFIENATTYDVVETPEQAFEVARAFGNFQRQLADLDPPRLASTIPGFHDTPRRWAGFRQTVDLDPCNRAALAADEIRRFEARAPMAGALIELYRDGLVPERIAHNDTKINNVLIDDDSGEAVCVIDLDTVMPGLALDDFGDLVRTSTCFAREDDPDLSKATVQLPIFTALARGYLSTLKGVLNRRETSSLVLAGKLMTFECGIRFLADYIDGDRYFRVHHPEHNLERARVQLALLESLEANEEAMQSTVERVVSEISEDS